MNATGKAGVVRFRQNCYVRATPSAAGAVLGVAKRGDALPFGGKVTREGWIMVEYRGITGWATGRFAECEHENA